MGDTEEYVCEFRDICKVCNEECRKFVKAFNDTIEKDKRSKYTESDRQFLQTLINMFKK
ncbi:MAG: hypothetical protein J1F61_00310 [Clostridiales bacterium]|nr:hypothetical protein [Clostridiales bacterium]